MVSAVSIEASQYLTRRQETGSLASVQQAQETTLPVLILPFDLIRPPRITFTPSQYITWQLARLQWER
jgi:hypothetical protein